MKKRFFSLLLCFSLLLGAAAYRPPQAEAFAVSGASIGVIAAAVAVASGINFLHSGMDQTGLADYFAGQIDNYCSSIGETVSDWWDGLGEDQVTVDANNRLILRAPAYAAVQSAVGWWRDQNAVQSGSSDISVYNGGFSVPLTSPAGTTIKIGAYNSGLLSGNSTKFFPSDFTADFADTAYSFGDAGYFKFKLSSYEGYNIGYSVKLKNSSGKYSSSTSSFYGPKKIYDQSLFLDSIASLYFLMDSENLYLCFSLSDGTRQSRIFSFDPEKTFSGSSSSSLSVSQPETYTELDIPDDAPGVALDLGLTAAADVDAALQQILEKLTANELAGTQTVAGSGEGEGEDEESPYLPYIPQIFQKLEALPDTIAGAVEAAFAPDEELLTEIKTTFADKFGWLRQLYLIVADLFDQDPDSGPPVITVYLSNANSHYGYDYGGEEVALDLSWYTPYKQTVDLLISGFLWLGFLWILFKRAAAIIQGGEMLQDEVRDLDAGYIESNQTKFNHWRDGGFGSGWHR